MLTSNYKMVEQAHNAPRVKCVYCKRHSRLKPYAGYYICIFCNAMHKLLRSNVFSKPRLNTRQHSF